MQGPHPAAQLRRRHQLGAPDALAPSELHAPVPEPGEEEGDDAGADLDLAHAQAVPAVDDAGARRLARDPGRGDAGDHDRGLDPRHAIGIAGPSASGKSTLAEALAGVWPAMGGKATLGGAALDQYGEADLARHLGWLPQEVVLFEGTVAENIARLAPEPDAEAVVEAAMRAGAHEMILALPGGYDFQVAAGDRDETGTYRGHTHLVRMNLVLRGDLLKRPVAPKRFQRHLRLQLPRKPASLAAHSHSSVRRWNTP